MAFRFYPRRSRAQKKRDLAKPLSGLPPCAGIGAGVDSVNGLSSEVCPRETVRRLSGFQGHHSEPDQDLSDAVGVVTPSHKGLD